ncbi:MAG: restriction endonuclease subunit S, partial [Ruminococcus sp.]|nr:restriction endonuclease subunit S [Ruminococcus sp.]
MKEMKDSGIEWIGEIPKHWRIVPVKYFILITNGFDPLTQSGDTCVYGSGSKSFKTCEEYKQGPAVLLGRKGTIDIPQWIDNKYWNIDTAFDAKPKNEDINLKLYYYLSVCFDYERYSMQTALPSMTQANYNNMRISLPPIEEQKKISTYLDNKCTIIDTIIEKQQKIIEKLKAYKFSLITETVTKGLNPDVKTKDSGYEFIGTVPEHWNFVKLGNIFTYLGGFAYNSNLYTAESD